MSTPSYIYSFNYDTHHSELCKLESRQLFNSEERNKLLFSDIKINPSISAFIKNRFEIILSTETYPELLKKIQEENICIHGFKAEYLLLHNDSTENFARRDKLKDVGYRIKGEPNFNTPSIIYSICNYNGIWYFGILKKHNIDWQKHKQKPHSFSSSLGMQVAKTLVSIASKGNKATTLLDTCCGVGTIMLEASISGFNIEGCDINWKACKHTRQNLAHYGYTAEVHCSDIIKLNRKYDTSIIDLPYNISSYSDDVITSNIIEASAKLTQRLVIVSISDIRTIIEDLGLNIIDFCTVEKKGRSTFARHIWICNKKITH